MAESLVAVQRRLYPPHCEKVLRYVVIPNRRAEDRTARDAVKDEEETGFPRETTFIDSCRVSLAALVSHKRVAR